MGTKTKILIVLSGLFALLFIVAPDPYAAIGLLSVPIGLVAAWQDHLHRKQGNHRPAPQD